MPKVSIVIPLYNKEDYIAATLNSILDQSFTDFEVIIVDDGSTDKSVKVAEVYSRKDERIKILKISNSGVSHARNVGLDRAEGEWIQFLDADDLIDRDYLATVFKRGFFFDTDIVFSSFQMVDSLGQLIRSIDIPYQGIGDQKLLCELFIRTQYETGFFGFISNKLFTRDLLVRSGSRFSEDIQLAEDLDFYSRLYPYVKKALFIDIRSFLYLQTGDNYSGREDIDYFKQLRIQMSIHNWFERTGFLKKYTDTLDRKVSDYVYYVIFYDYEGSGTLTEDYFKIVNNKKIMTCVRPELTSGFEKWVLWGVCLNSRTFLATLLLGRTKLRAIYRRIHGKQK